MIPFTVLIYSTPLTDLFFDGGCKWILIVSYPYQTTYRFNFLNKPTRRQIRKCKRKYREWYASTKDDKTEIGEY